MPQFFGKWWKIDARRDAWSETVRHLDRARHAGARQHASWSLKTNLPAQIAAELAPNVAAYGISEREAAVLRLIAEGYRNKNIAHQLGMAEDKVKAHIKRCLPSVIVKLCG